MEQSNTHYTDHTMNPLSNPQVQFVTDNHGLTKAVIDNSFAHCEIYLHGAHVTSFIPKGHDDLLWLSKAAIFNEAKAIRGGIPLCWPWFGPHITDSTKTAHGFARVSLWQVHSVQTTDDGATEIILALSQSEQTLTLWPYRFKLQYKVTVADTLSVSLTTINTNDCDIQISEALHSYLLLGDIHQSQVNGLDGVSYADKVGGSAMCAQSGDIVVGQEVDRVYLNTANTCMVTDEQKQRKISVSKSGSADTIVWNPWQDKSKGMADVHDDGYLTMVCIEAGNVLDNLVTIAAGESHCISQRIGILLEVEQRDFISTVADNQ